MGIQANETLAVAIVQPWCAQSSQFSAPTANQPETERR
jgi:hypothetical protein